MSAASIPTTPPDSGTSPKRLLCWGFVRGPHALKGWLRVSAHSGEGTDPTFKHIYIGDVAETAKPFEVTEGRPFKDGVLLLIKGHDDHASVALWDKLKRLSVWVDRAELDATGEDEFYFADLVGLTVLNTDGHKIGTVEGIEERFDGLTTVVINRGSHRARVPFHDAFVGDVNLDAGTLALRQEPVPE